MKTSTIDARFVRYYNFQGKRYTCSCVGQTANQTSGAVIIFSQYNNGRIENKAKRVTASVLIHNNGEIAFDARLQGDFAPMGENEIVCLKERLKKLNLTIKEYELSKVMYPLFHEPYTQITKGIGLAFDDKDKVRYKYQGQLLSKNEFKKAAVPENLSLVLYYDNGYSYIGTEPTTKNCLIYIAGKIISSPLTSFYYGTGLDLTQDGQTKEIAVNVRLGQTKSFSEVSNT